MRPEDELCKRVLHLAGAAGVPPIVSAHLGQAVAQYKRDTAPDVLFARAVWLGTVGGILAIGGLVGVYQLPFGESLDWGGTACLLLAVAAQLAGGTLLAVAGVRLSRLRR